MSDEWPLVPACMSAEEYAAWDRVPRPPEVTVCTDCTPEFRRRMTRAGVCHRRPGVRQGKEGDMDASWRTDERAQASRMRGAEARLAARPRPDMAELTFDLTPCEGCVFAPVCKWRAIMAASGDAGARLPDLGPDITVAIHATIECALRRVPERRPRRHVSAEGLAQVRENARKAREAQAAKVAARKAAEAEEVSA